MIDYLKIGKATELSGADRRLYRFLEILPGFLSWGTLLSLLLLSYWQPIFVAFFIIAFDVYWLLLVVFLGVHLLVAYNRLQKNIKIDWGKKCFDLGVVKIEGKQMAWDDLIHLIFFPTYNENLEVIRTSFSALLFSNYPLDKMVVVLAVEERGGETARINAEKIKNEFGNKFKDFFIFFHPDGIEGELKGKGANQAWAASALKRDYVDKNKLDYDKILVSVFDIDTVIYPDYFYNLTYKFLTVPNPYRASYQPIPVYHNNIWQAPFFARIAASSNTFWQMMQQIRQEKLATYSSHSMTWRALVDIGFWSTKMVSEDSRIFWHCFCYYKGDYRVEPMNYPVSMDACMDKTIKQTATSLYKQQRRWGWGVENLPYLIFNTIKNWRTYPKMTMLSRIFTQLYGFHSWATNALIIAVIGWMPLFLGGDAFNSTTLSANLPMVTRTLMTFAMSGLVLSSIIATLLLPEKPKHYGFWRTILIPLQWVILPVSIIVFGSIPGLDSQTKLMFGRYMGFWVTPKSR
jgi:cellulose synthase/poly-beta-1,6-N-acetylglucosamine synthase-like glycosyltransferase